MNLNKTPHAFRLSLCLSSSSSGVRHAPIYRQHWQHRIPLSSIRWPIWSLQRSVRFVECIHAGRTTINDNGAYDSVSLRQRSCSIITRCLSQGIRDQDQHHLSSSSWYDNDRPITEKYNVSKHQLEKLQMFAKLVIEENNKVNLISRVKSHHSSLMSCSVTSSIHFRSSRILI